MLSHLENGRPRQFPRSSRSTNIAFKTGKRRRFVPRRGDRNATRARGRLCADAKNEDQRYVPDNAGNRLCAEVAREVFLHFGGKLDSSTTR